MRYLGGKKRQFKAIIRAIEAIRPGFSVYAEPFCGEMWSATAVIEALPRRRYFLSDVNPYLIRFWRAAVFEGWDPPADPTEDEWRSYQLRKPVDDPMTGYLGFAWSFGGKFFGGAARDKTGGTFKGSYRSTCRKIDILRRADVRIECRSYDNKPLPLGCLAYLDPPYEGRTHQAHKKINGGFDHDRFRIWAEGQAARATILTTEFVNPNDWEVVHNYGDTVIRHHSGNAPDGTQELLMKVLPANTLTRK